MDIPFNKPVRAGVYLAKITTVNVAQKGDGAVVVNRNKSAGVDITFLLEKTGETITDRFWLDEKSEWKIKALAKACNIDDYEDGIEADFVDTRLWIIVAENHLMYSGQPLRNIVGDPLVYDIVAAKYIPLVMEDVPPVLEGDPARHGTASGAFRVETEAAIALGYDKARQMFEESMQGSVNTNL